MIQYLYLGRLGYDEGLRLQAQVNQLGLQPQSFVVTQAAEIEVLDHRYL